MLILEDQCFMANVGDSKAVMSVGGGKIFLSLCQEHVLSDVREASRVMVAGTTIYQEDKNAIKKDVHNLSEIAKNCNIKMDPCGLTVSRIIGHTRGKTQNPDALIAEPDIQTFPLKNNHDFILLGSSNVFEMDNGLDDIN